MARPRAHRTNRTRSKSRSAEFSQSVALAPELVSAPRDHIWWAKVPALFILAASVWLLAVMHGAPRFGVSEVVVEGAYLIDANYIRVAAGVQGTNIFRVRPYDVDRRLRDAFGCIDEVDVTCKLPGSVSIKVRERAAVMIWQSGGRYWWIGSDGNILGTTEVVGNLPIIHDVAGSMVEPTDYLVGIPWRLAQEMVNALPSATSYDYVNGLGLVIYVTDAKWPVYLGYEGSAESKVAILQALVSHLAEQAVDVEYIDLRNEHSPMYKKRL